MTILADWYYEACLWLWRVLHPGTWGKDDRHG